MALAISSSDLAERYSKLSQTFTEVQRGCALQKWKEILGKYIQNGPQSRALKEGWTMGRGKEEMQPQDSRDLGISNLRSQVEKMGDVWPRSLTEEFRKTIEKIENCASRMFSLNRLSNPRGLIATLDKTLQDAQTVNIKLQIECEGVRLEELNLRYVEARTDQSNEVIQEIRKKRDQIREEIRKAGKQGWSDRLRDALEKAKIYCQYHENFGVLKNHCQEEITANWRSEFWNIIKKLWEIGEQDSPCRTQYCVEILAKIVEQKNQDRLFGFSLENHVLEGLEVMEFLLQNPPSEKRSRKALDTLRINFGQSVCVFFFDEKAETYDPEIIEKYARRAYEELESKHHTQKTGTKPVYLLGLQAFLYDLDKERGEPAQKLEEMEKKLDELHKKADQMLPGRGGKREEKRGVQSKHTKKSGHKRPHDYDHGSTPGARQMHGEYNRRFQERYQQLKRDEIGNDLSDLLEPAPEEPKAQEPFEDPKATLPLAEPPCEQKPPISTSDETQKTPSPAPRQPSGIKIRSKKEPMSKERKLEIGKKGEEVVYKELLDRYNRKYSHCEQKEIPLGMEWVNQESGSVEVRLIWHNKKTESEGPKDLTVEKPLKSRVIEVKATESKDNQRIYLSWKEYQEMVDKGDRYTIFRVYDVMSKNARFTKYKNPVSFYSHPESLPKAYPGMGQIHFKAVIDLPKRDSELVTKNPPAAN